VHAVYEIFASVVFPKLKDAATFYVFVSLTFDAKVQINRFHPLDRSIHKWSVFTAIAGNEPDPKVKIGQCGDGVALPHGRHFHIRTHMAKKIYILPYP
jgi:hypothetical protein